MFQALILVIMMNSFVFAWDQVSKVMDQGFTDRIFPGASLLVGNHEGELFRYSVGESYSKKIYDIASLTKVVSTTTLVMMLIEVNKIKLTDKVSTYFPHFTSPLKNDVTLEDLLRHRAGLPSGARPHDGESFDQYIERITKAPLAYGPRTQTVYSDLSFILLGKLVEMISGKNLEDLAQDRIFNPLGMTDTSFLVSDLSRCAPTVSTRQCEVHDPTAFHLLPHHVGNAGLFSTLENLNKFVRLILNRGELDGVRLLKESTVEMMLKKDGPRGLGWDYESEFSKAPRGDVFPLGISFGHTGYTGTTIWIDPASRSYYIFLSNRVAMGDERTKKPFSEMRKKLSTEIGKAILSY